MVGTFPCVQKDESVFIICVLMGALTDLALWLWGMTGANSASGDDQLQ